MLTVADKTKMFITRTLSPNKLADEEVRALWAIAKYNDREEALIVRTDQSRDCSPCIFTSSGHGINIPRYIIGTLEWRGILKRRYVNEYIRVQGTSISYYTWDIIWKKTTPFPQLKELSIQKALGSI